MAVKLGGSGSEATRDGFGKALAELAARDKRIIALGADLEDSTRADMIAGKQPDRLVRVGIAEQDMVGIAAGLSLAGFVPFATSFGSFMLRAYDQIRVSVAYSNLNVKLVSTHCGVTTGEDGASAQVLEDIAAMRALPNMKVVAPCDAVEAGKATVAAAETAGPFYLRLGRPKVPIITSPDTPFSLGRAEVFRDGSDVALVACGITVGESIKAAEVLEKEEISARVLNVHTIKPIDVAALKAAAKDCGIIVSAEEHQVAGGLGSAIAEALSEKPVPLVRVGIQDRFGETGKPDELLEKFGLDSVGIADAVRRAVKLR